MMGKQNPQPLFCAKMHSVRFSEANTRLQQSSQVLIFSSYSLLNTKKPSFVTTFFVNTDVGTRGAEGAAAPPEMSSYKKH